MDLPWGDEISVKFITNVGLITTDGPIGPNVMACEWTHHISYKPGLIAVCIHQRDATDKNIEATKEFGVNLCSTDQSVMASVAGGYTGKKHNKVDALKKLGFEFYEAKKIKPPMIKGASVNIECKLFKKMKLGSHIMFVGEVVEASNNPGKEPLAYHKGKYWIIDKNVEKPSDEERERTKKTINEFKRE